MQSSEVSHDLLHELAQGRRGRARDELLPDLEPGMALASPQVPLGHKLAGGRLLWARTQTTRL